MNQKKHIHPEMQFEDIEQLVNDLSDEDKRKLVQKLIGGEKSPLTVIVGGYNVVNNSVSLQLNGDLESVVEQLRNFPDDKLQLLIRALSELVYPT